MRPLLAAGALAGAVVLIGAGQPASAESGGDCDRFQVETPPQPADDTSVPLELLGVARAQELLRARGIEPGAGANVAVLDSGVRDEPGVLDVLEAKSFTGRSDLVDTHGTAVAGVIAGQPRPGGRLVGVAPGAKIIDVRVYDTGDPGSSDPTELTVDPNRLAEGLEWVADNARRLEIKVANVSLAVRDTGRLEAAVERLWRRGVLVVASSGNRPGEDGEFGYEQFGGAKLTGEDAKGEVFPAAYPGVVAVNATADPTGTDPTLSVLQSSDTDVAAPTYGLVSVAVNGSRCVINQIATSWSAALVSGVVSMLSSAYDERPAQIVARLTETANGTVDTPTKVTGYGVVQPVEALTRPLSPDRDGTLARAVVEHDDERATRPDPREDPLASTRDSATWWGLIGGGVLAVLLLLRPVLSRR